MCVFGNQDPVGNAHNRYDNIQGEIVAPEGSPFTEDISRMLQSIACRAIVFGMFVGTFVPASYARTTASAKIDLITAQNVLVVKF